MIINQSHIDFKALKGATAAAHTYVQFLISKLFVEEYMPNERKEIFSQEFEESWLPFAMKYITPKIPKGSTSKGRPKK